MARKSAKPSPISAFLARKSAKLFANFSAPKVTSLPSVSVSLKGVLCTAYKKSFFFRRYTTPPYLSLSLSLTLSPSAPHARKRLRAAYIVRVPGREFRFLAPTARQHLFLKLNQLILWRRIRICLLSFRQSCECCQTNGFARPVLRDRVSLATKVTCATAHTKVCSFCPHFRLFCSNIINFSKKIFAHQ